MARPAAARPIAELWPSRYGKAHERDDAYRADPDHYRRPGLQPGRNGVSAHALYVTAAYAVTAIVLAGLIGWVLLGLKARKRELAELEAAGIRRRSDRAGKP
jgi:heme exporter protein D